MSRITDDSYSQVFANGRNKFYLEFRCNRPCISHHDTCAKCIEKSITCSLQTSRKFNHGKVNEPIPDNSHIYGGKWFSNAVKKWGSPPIEIIEVAKKYQDEARGDFIVSQPMYEDTSKEKEYYNYQTMPRPKKVDNTINVETGQNKENTEKPIKQRRKPKIAEDTTSVTEEVTPKKRVSRKKPQISPYSSLIENTKQLIHKEVSIPTHIETTMEEFDTEDYDIEYVKLTLFELNGVSYFRDSKKNKLYKKIKDKTIGPYVGRYNPDTDMLYTTIPDSDEE
jgi:hypothetical protein